MKKILKAVAICMVCSASLSMVSCTSGTKQATQVAQDFLTSYFATDYQSAAACCTEELSATLMEAVEEYYQMEENLREEVVDISSSVVTTIQTVESVGKDTVVINYDIQMPEPEPLIKSTLTVAKVDGAWRIAEF